MTGHVAIRAHVDADLEDHVAPIQRWAAAAERELGAGPSGHDHGVARMADFVGVPCSRGAAPGDATRGDHEDLFTEGDDRTSGLAATEKSHVDLSHAVADALRPDA